jgi:hypothetical protein
MGIFREIISVADQPVQNLATASAVLPQELPSMVILSYFGLDDFILRTLRAV